MRMDSLPSFVSFALLGAVAALGGCDRAIDQPPPVQSRITLQSFTDCGALEKYIEDTAVREMRTQLQGEKDGWAWGYGGRGGLAEAGPPAAADANSAPTAYTRTNVQVQGVDEADFMKNDGTRIFVLSGRKLFAATSWPPADLSLTGTLLIEGWPDGMFLDEKNRVVVFSSVWLKEFDNPNGGGGGGGGGAPVPCLGGGDCGYGGNAVKITVVDVSALAKPVVKAEYYLPGWYSNARRVGSSVRMVLSDWFRWPVALKWWPDWLQVYDRNRLAEALDQLADDNERIIRAQTLSQWLPDGKRKLDSGELVDLGYQCSDFYMTNAPVRLGLVTVASLDLDAAGAPPTRASLLAEPGEVYASTKNLYLASQHWWWWPQLGQVDHTYIHKFDITDPRRARYVASGGVPGHIVDQFSMDENADGWFRVASTISSRVPDDLYPQNTWGRIVTTNRVFVLGESGGALAVVGRTDEMAPGERIQSARFVENRGFVVTFRQVDPLFTLDLTDPAAPRTVGQLKVPGFSSYVHPLDRDHLLTIGVYVPDPQNGQPDWRQRSMQLSIFDVSDFAHPQQTANALVGTAYGWSDAAWEHKAFNYFSERKLLAIPFSDYQPVVDDRYWDSFTSDVRVFSIDVDKGIAPLGGLGMKDVYQQLQPSWSWYYSPWVRRSVMASDDQKNDFVYAVSDAGIRVANVQSLARPIATALFPEPIPNP